jgi:hypothetical protein
MAAWQRLGPRRGTSKAFRVLGVGARTRVRRSVLARRPLQVTPSEMRTALGSLPPRDALRGPVLAAMPTVSAFERRLDGMAPDERADLLAVADRAASHTFDLLGSGPTDLGKEIDWSCDFKSGRRWPLDHISKVRVIYGDGSDIKVPWELSRFQHLPVFAAAHRLTGERRWLDEIGFELEHWIAANPVEFGPNWACTMDVAIRAANWVAALALVADAAADEPWLEPAIGSLLLHGRFIRTHLEWASARGNHYLSDVVGLLCVAAVFANGAEGRAWAEWAASELVLELDHQVRSDGCDHEASIPYHRLVTELFTCGFQAAEVLVPGSVSAADNARLEKMLAFVSDYTRPDGLAPQVGDADDGRFLPLADYGVSDPRSHLHLFTQADRAYVPSDTSSAYPEGGYWIMRGGGLYLIVRCGDVGVGGQGSHAHNDALSFELALGDQPIVVDPGSYVYSADPAERNRFRSTAFHSTMEIDGVEQNPIGDGIDSLFQMPDVRRADALTWEADTTCAVFVGRHFGYERLSSPATHKRRVELSATNAEMLITDTVSSSGEHGLRWTFPLMPCTVAIGPGVATARFPSGVIVEIFGEDLEFEADDEWISPSYGRRIQTPFVRASKRSRPGQDVTTIRVRIHAPA